MAAKEKEKDSKALPAGQGEPVKKKSRLKRIIILVVILLMLLSGAGIGAYWWFFMRTPSDGGGDGGDAPVEAGATGAEAGAPSSGGKDGAAPGAPAGAPGGTARIERQSSLPRSGGLVLPLPQVTVNIADPSGRRYLKLGMEVEVNADVAAAIKSNSARIRDAIIMLLAGKTVGDLTSPDGKVLLKAEVAARLNQILGAQRVVRVYFTDFVVE